MERDCLQDRIYTVGQSQWQRGPRRAPGAARLLRLWVPIPVEEWVSVSCQCCVFSGGGLIIRPEGSYVAWCVCV